MQEAHGLQKRQIAYKVRIKDILNSEYVKTGGFNPNYLKINSQEISRVNIIGVVVYKSGLNNYNTLTIDDGSGKINARIFENNISFDRIGVSDVVLTIGRPREFSSERYIIVEIIKKIDLVWTKVRKLELEKNTGNNAIPGETKFSVKGGADLQIHKILKFIKELDSGNGVSIEDVLSKNRDCDEIIDTLLKQGDIFEIKPGKLKVL